MLRDTLGVALVATVVVLAAPTSPGECKSLSSLSFVNQPTVANGLSTRVIYNGLTRPRGLRIDALENLLVIDRGTGLLALSYRNDSTCAGWERRVVVANADLNHGIEIGPSGGDNQFLYASTSDSVYRWEYDPGSVAVVGGPVTIAWNMSNADHTTRTLLLQPKTGSVSQYIIVTRGSESNLDGDAGNLSSGRSQIRRFALSSNMTNSTGWAWERGELLGWGLRNAVGIALSKDGNDLWEVENSADDISWHGVDVHQDNPAEELNLISLTNISAKTDAEKYHGYPSCYTAWDSTSVSNLTSSTGAQFIFPTGSQFSIRDPPLMQDDAWCAADGNNIKPVMSLQAHSAPLDIVFYEAPSDASEGASTSRLYAVNTSWDGDAFVSFHGSWNRDPPTGYKVVRIPWSNSTPTASAESRDGYETVVGAPDVTKCPSGCIRPVGLAFDRLGRLFVSSDTTGEIFVVESSTAPDEATNTSPASVLRASAVTMALGIIMIIMGNWI